jgi:hypothetical protein
VRVVQLHETFLRDTDSGLDARVVSLSDPALQASADWIGLLSRGPLAIGRDLGLADAMQINHDDLQAAVRLVLDPAVLVGGIREPFHDTWLEYLESGPNQTVAGFAEFVMHEQFVPFAASPLELKALHAIASLPPTGLGAAAVFAVFVFGASPLLLIALPAGIVICGAANGVSRALDEGLHDRLLRKLAPHHSG